MHSGAGARGPPGRSGWHLPLSGYELCRIRRLLSLPLDAKDSREAWGSGLGCIRLSQAENMEMMADKMTMVFSHPTPPKLHLKRPKSPSLRFTLQTLKGFPCSSRCPGPSSFLPHPQEETSLTFIANVKGQVNFASRGSQVDTWPMRHQQPFHQQLKYQRGVVVWPQPEPRERDQGQNLEKMLLSQR